jgi:hypothetical protein
MGVLLKYTLEGIVIAGATLALTRGKISQKNILLLIALSVFIFIILDLVAPISAAHVQLGGAPDAMCGGGLVQALQDVPVLTGGSVDGEDEVNDQTFKFQNHPYKLHMGVLSAGYNEYVQGFEVKS